MNIADTTPLDTFSIDSMETMRLLMDVTRLELIERLAVPRSVTELADDMGVPRTRLYHHIQILEEIGAIVVVDQRTSGARTEKVYRVAAWRFSPSESFLSSVEPREQAEAIFDSLVTATRADFLRALELGLFSLNQKSESRSVTLGRHVLTLTTEQATTLLDELEQLFADYEKSSEFDGPPTHAALVFLYPTSRGDR